MIYGIFSGEYSDWEVEGCTDDLDMAYKYCAIHPECYIIPMNDIKIEHISDKIDFVYRIFIGYRLDMNGHYNRTNDVKEDSEKPWLSWECVQKDETTLNRINRGRSDISNVLFEIYFPKIDTDLAYKIAADYMAELLSYGEGKITQETLVLMNHKLEQLHGGNDNNESI